MNPYEELVAEVNKQWKRLYPESEDASGKAILLRVKQIAEDRNCWLSIAKANEKEYQKIEKILKSQGVKIS